MADEYSDKDLYGDYSYEDADTPASLSALVAAFRNLTVNSAMIENLAVQDGHIQSVAAGKILAGEIQVDSNNLAFNALWKKDTLGWDLGTGVTRPSSTTHRLFGGYNVQVNLSGLTSPVWRGAKTNVNYRIPCREGDEFTASVYFYTDNYTTFDSTVGLELEWFDSSGVRIATSAYPYTPDVNKTWKRLIKSGTAPASTASVGINFWVRQNGQAIFMAPQLQRGKFLTEFTDNGTYIGPNGIMTTDLKFSGTLEGANGTFTGKLTSDGPDHDVVIDGGYVRTYDSVTGVIYNQIGNGGVNIKPESATSRAWFDLAGIGGRHGGVIWSLTHNGEGAADAFEIYTNKKLVLDVTELVVGTAGDKVVTAQQYRGKSIELRSEGGTPYIDFSNDLTSDYDARIILGGANELQFFQNGALRHNFKADGSKTGGSIEVDGENLGMSPIDSPQVPIEYVEFDIQLSPEGTRVSLDARFVKAVEKFAVFQNKGEIIEKGTDYFIIAGEGAADCRIIGLRNGYSNVFWADMSA